MTPTTNKSPRWRFGLLLLLALLGSCSSTTFVYNRLDFLLPWYVGRYVDLDREQSKRLDQSLDSLLAWHRSEELPRYAGFAAEMEAQIDQGPVELATVEAYTDEFEAAWYRIRDRVLEDMLSLGETLSDEQLGEFIAALEKKQRKYERKYLQRDEEKFRDDTYSELCDTFKGPLGRLTAAQRERIKLAAGDLRRSDSSWLKERAEWIAVTAQDLQREPGWQERIRDRVVNWESHTNPDRLALYEHNTLTIQKLIVDVVNIRTERQEKRVRRRLDKYRKDFETLASQTQ